MLVLRIYTTRRDAPAFRAPPLEKSFTNQPGWTNRAGRWPQLQEGLPFLFCPAHRFAEARGIGSLEALPLLLNQGWRRLKMDCSAWRRRFPGPVQPGGGRQACS